MKKISSQPSPDTTERGRKIVEAKLIKSACKLLSKNGPKAVTIRDIAKHAGVNHGQVHHYFGSKKNLLSAAIRHLADKHHEHHELLSLNEHYIAPALSLSKDKDYIMAVIRSVIDGDLDLATLELSDGTSVPRTIMEKLSKSHGLKECPTELKSRLLVSFCIEWGWAALGPYFMQVLDVKDHEYENVRSGLADISHKFALDLQRNMTKKN